MGPDAAAESWVAGSLSDWVANAVPDGLWVLDEQGCTLFANEPMAALLGVEPHDAPGLSAYDVLDPADAQVFRDHQAALRADPAPRGEVRVSLRPSGAHPVPVSLSATPLRDDRGEQRGWLHRVREDTAPVGQSALEDYARRQKQFLDAQRIARVGSWDWELTSEDLAWSDELYHVFGLDHSFQPSWKSFMAQVHTDDRKRVAERFADALGSDAPFSVDFRFVPEGREARWVRGRGVVVRGEDGRVLRVHGTAQDIGESKDVENALAFLSAMGRAANEASSLQDVLVAADSFVRPYAQWSGVLVSVPARPGSEELTHIDLDWGPGGPSLRDFARDLAQRVARERRVVESVGPSGTVLIAGPVLAKGRLACILVANTLAPRDPTALERDVFGQILTLLAHVAEREWVAEELAAARDQALSASKAKSEFLATMSHEIRTPLNGVIGLSELLSTTELTPHQRRLTEGVDQAGRTLLALVNDILDLSKIEAGRLNLEEVDFDPRRIIEQSAALVADGAREKHLELVVSSAADVPGQVRGDPVRFGQVITNLVANAVKFTAEGEVVIRATGVPTSEGTQLRVEVSDTGVGIAPEVAGRLFQPFSQADSSTTREYGGTGLGLAISKRIVNAMAGEIGFDSELGVGSTFWFTVALGHPVNDGPDRDAACERAVAGLRVLIVDDNETNRFILKEKLTAWQVDVKAVTSAYEGLVELEASGRSGTPYDIALLDYMMPGADGEQLARIIRAEPRNDRTRIALLSSAMEPTAEFLTDAGIDAFLGKPVLPSRLLELLAMLGGRPAETDEPTSVADSTPDSLAAGTRGRVLVVEDNPVNQLVAEGVLERLGYDVLVAGDGAAGVSAYAADVSGFDLVLMDCQMPVMDGYEAAKAIRAMPSDGTRIPIIAMTAGAELEERERCLAAGMDDFLLKPVDVTLMQQTLERWIARDDDAAAATPREGGGAERNVPDPVPDTATPARAPRRRAALDRSRLLELLETGAADLALLFRILERFGNRAEDATTTLRTAVHALDAEEVGRLAHGLRGSAANVGLAHLAELCEGVELAAAEGRLPDPSTLVEIEDEVDAGVSELEGFARDMVRDAAAAGGSLKRETPTPSHA
jgi:PAS domain S-box-containing protein